MKNLLKAEELFMFLASIYFFSLLDYQWWIYPTVLLLPDISFLAYAVNPKAGAIAYNILHHKGTAIIVGLAGVYLNNELLQLSGIILFGHSSMDRMLGYGLKYFSGFHHTHLGDMKNNKGDKSVSAASHF